MPLVHNHDYCKLSYDKILWHKLDLVQLDKHFSF